MGKKFESLTEKQVEFISAQKIFFVATATADSRINLSPKGMDSLRVLAPNRIAWLNVTGSGNETAAHVAADGRMTLTWCAFEGSPVILRAYGRATSVHPGDERWPELVDLFPRTPGTRQIFELQVELVQSSCGMGVPRFDYVDDREALNDWARRKGEDGVRRYWLEKNQRSIDGLETGIAEGGDPSADD